jgi:hypothetical protein
LVRVVIVVVGSQYNSESESEGGVGGDLAPGGKGKGLSLEDDIEDD